MMNNQENSKKLMINNVIKYINSYEFKIKRLSNDK